MLGRDTRGPGWSRSARPGRGASRETCARRRTPRAKPKPPWVWRQALAACHDASAASSFAMLASAPHGSPASNSAAALAAHQVGRLDLGVGAGDRELRRPGSGRSAGRTRRARLRSATRLLDEPARRRRCIRRRSGCARRSCRRGCSGSPCPPRRSRFSAGTSSVVEEQLGGAWLIIVAIGRIVSPSPAARAGRRGTPTARRSAARTSSSGVVRASRSIRSRVLRARGPDLLPV